jgi:hypothetical protein
MHGEFASTVPLVSVESFPMRVMAIENTCDYGQILCPVGHKTLLYPSPFDMKMSGKSGCVILLKITPRAVSSA